MKLVASSVILLVAFVSTWATTEFEPISGGRCGIGKTTRYWDCCKPSCAWKENIQTADNIPVNTCKRNGEDVVDASTASVCDGGSAYVCNSQQPWAVNDTLAYGFAAASFTGGADYSFCCACFKLDFTDQIVGKTLILQVSNSGADLGYNQFDIAMPGGGVGLFAQGCNDQWNAPWTGWGDLYGGVHSKEECISLLPPELHRGCLFRFGFMNNAANPGVEFTQIKCPKEIVDVSGCSLDV